MVPVMLAESHGGKFSLTYFVIEASMESNLFELRWSVKHARYPETIFLEVY